MLDIAILRVIWWLLLGILFTGFAVMDGFDLGTAILLPLLAKNEEEREQVLNTIRPVWEGNQVWIVLGAGAIFAAWPYVYAAVFSGAYFLILLLLLTMGISRPVSFKYRSKLPYLFWRRFWDWTAFVGGFCPAIIFGILIGNVILGMPFSLDSNLRLSYTGSFLQLFNSFTLLCGLVSVMMLVMHGGVYLVMKTTASVQKRALLWSKIAALGTISGFILGGVWMIYLPGYQLVSPVDPYGYSNPLYKEVVMNAGAWLKNYSLYPLASLAPILGFIGPLGVLCCAQYGEGRLAFLFSGVGIAGIIGSVGVSMFPFILPSSTQKVASLLVWDASSSQFTLLVMLGAVIVFFPIVLLYTSWVYRVLRGKTSAKSMEGY